MKAGAVRKNRALTRICVVLGVILILSSFGMTLTAAASNENAPGQDQCDDGHGANDKPCKPDNEHGQDCEEHGNGGVNEDHCIPDEGTTTGGTSTGGTSTGSSTGEGTGNSTGNSTGNGTGNSTGEGTGNSTGNGTGSSTGNGTGNSTGNATGNSTGEGTTGGSSTGSSTGGSSTGSSTGGSSTGSSTGGSSTGSGAVVEDEVLGRVIERDPLAQTGSTTTILAVFGFGLLMVGSILRFGRFGTSVTK